MRINTIGLAVKDIDKSIDFYEKAFGFELVQGKREIPQGVNCFMKSGDMIVELVQFKGQEGGNPNGVINHIGFFVDNLEKEIERMKDLGIKFETNIEGHIPPNQILQVEGGKIFYFRGLSGEYIGLIEVDKNHPFRK